MALVTRRRGRIAAIAAALVLAGGSDADRVLLAALPTEYEVKAAYLYNFGKFVDWPPAIEAERNEPFVIAIVGADPFGRVIDTMLWSKTIDGRPVRVERWTRSDEIGAAHILFVSASESHVLDQILERAQRWHVLTVGDTDGFVERGGIIEFGLVDDKVRFEINKAAAERAGLRLSSQLLRLATSVTTEG